MKNIKLQRSQALLKELVTEALSTLEDPDLNSLSVTDALCSRGKYHAEIFIESSDLSLQEKTSILRNLKKAEGLLRNYILSASGWFKCPKLSFKFDDSLKSSKTLDQLFEQIQRERKI